MHASLAQVFRRAICAQLINDLRRMMRLCDPDASFSSKTELSDIMPLHCHDTECATQCRCHELTSSSKLS